MTSTHPTRGLTPVVNNPLAASCRARAIQAASSATGGCIVESSKADIRSGTGAFAGLGHRRDLANHFGELINVGEVPVHRGKSHVGHFVDFLEFAHHQLTDLL